MTLTLLILALLALALLARAASADPFTYEWGHPSPQGNTIFGIAFADDMNGWAVAGGGCVLRTGDGGEHWELLHGPLDIAPALHDVIVSPAGTLLACGSGDGLYRSTDGGATWDAPPHPASGAINDLCLAPGGSISAAGEEGVILLSTDDGQNWNSVGPGQGLIRQHLWTTPSTGYAVGREVSHRTTDGGATWNQFIPPGSFGYNDVYFVDSSRGYVIEDFGYWFTTNGGVSWSQEFLPIQPLYRYRTLVLSADHWLLVCHGEGGELWETTNAGVDWTSRQFHDGVGFPCITSAPGGRVFYGSDLGDIFYSDDLGLTVTNGIENLGGEDGHASIEGVFVRPDGVVFAANQPTMGGTPAWLRSDDGGRHWHVPAHVPGLHWAFQGGFADDARGFVAYQEQIRATFDGGETWQAGTPLPSGHRVTTASLPATDRYFVGTSRNNSDGSVFRSTDGGIGWTEVGGGLPMGTVTFYSVQFPTSSVGFAGGATSNQQARLYRTTDGGATWQQVATTGLGDAIRSMTWFDPQTAVASLGVNDPGIHRTVDGGATWAPVHDQSFVKLTRKGATEAMAVPLFGTAMFRTTDAGLTWEELKPPFSGPFPGMPDYVNAAAPTADGWILGGSRNRLLVAIESGASGVAVDPSAPTPTSPLRLLTGPNPVYSKTSVFLYNDRPGRTRVDVHEAGGRRVSTLLDAELPAGRHAVSWDGTDDGGQALPSGVYFVRSTSSAGRQTVKVTLVR